MAERIRQIEGGLWGLLVGDALGVPYEFHPPEEIPPFEEIDMIPPMGFPRSYAHIKPGTWSDDGAQALCLMASLLECFQWSIDDFAMRLLKWSAYGYMAVGGRVFDIGIQTGSALSRFASGRPPHESGLHGERNNGNGSMMRVLPAALLFTGPDEDLVALAHEQSLVTHRHPRSQVCCSLYCLWARFEMLGSDDPWAAAVSRLRGIYTSGSQFRRELESVILPAADLPPGGTGYVVDSLHSARHACRGNDYASIVRAAISLGHDTDTTACLAGGIAGIRHGKNGIPQDWRELMRGTDLFLTLLGRCS
ncbi:ADP-ribosylglycohydrolase family protein [Haloferula sargassicola]|uniref:ADP-ribosylarginine hydrolase Tri1 n=1 Tax=Haloferula sargassicola TaxID=490096 RepID=A0ABP9UR73_9BACT